MYQLAFLSALMGPLAAFEDFDSGQVIVAEDTRERYVQLREGRDGYVFSGHEIKSRQTPAATASVA